jgi:hypothetical protein
MEMSSQLAAHNLPAEVQPFLSMLFSQRFAEWAWKLFNFRSRDLAAASLATQHRCQAHISAHFLLYKSLRLTAFGTPPALWPLAYSLQAQSRGCVKLVSVKGGLRKKWFV